MNWTINMLIVQIEDLEREIRVRTEIMNMLKDRIKKLKEEENGKKNETQQR